MIDQRNELHDERVSALYRETRDVEPPARLDRHILKMAGVAVRSRPVSPSPPWRRAARWTVPLALAATVVLTVGVVRMVRESGEFASVLKLEAPRPLAEPVVEADAVATRRAEPPSTAKLPQAASPAVMPARPTELSKPAPVIVPPSPAVNDAPPTSFPVSPTSLSSPSSAPFAAPEQHTTMSAERKKEATLNIAPASAAAQGEEGKLDWNRLTDRSPAEWLKEIAELRRQGRTAEAEARLSEFRRQYPDYPLDARTAPR